MLDCDSDEHGAGNIIELSPFIFQGLFYMTTQYSHAPRDTFGTPTILISFHACIVHCWFLEPEQGGGEWSRAQCPVAYLE